MIFDLTGEAISVNRFNTASTVIIVVTDRTNRDSLRPLLQQMQRIGYGVFTLPRVAYEHTRHLPTPQVVMVDVASKDFQRSGSVGSIRATWEYVPIVLLAKLDELSRLQFGNEFHCFLTLPITSQELEARIRFAQWKSMESLPSNDILEVDNVRLNLATYEVFVDGQPVEMTYKEFELLKFFLNHKRRVFSRADLLATVWESDYYGGTRTVDVHIRRLRAKLGEPVGNRILTVRNVGYRFN